MLQLRATHRGDASHDQLATELRAFLAEHPPPHDDGSFEVGLDWQRTLFEGGWVAPQWPVDLGGRGLSPREYATYLREMAAVRAPQLANRVAINMIGPTIHEHGTPEQRSEHLGPILSGERIWCQLFSEPDAGSDLASVSTRADDDGDCWSVTGQKVWSSFANESDMAVLLARTEPGSHGTRGLTYMICDMRAAGVEVRPTRQMTGESEFGEVFLDEVVVPKSAALGPVGEGWRVMQTTLANERGLAFPLKEQIALRRQLDDLLEGCRSQELAAPVREQLVEAIIRMTIFELMNRGTLEIVEAGRDPGARASIVKLVFADVAQMVQEVDASVRGLGMFTGDPAGWRRYLWYRSASISGGTSEVQRNIIGERLLGLPREPR